MRTGLISDTHAPAMGRFPSAEVERAFEGVDLILHAGDIYSPECLDWLERIAPVLAVEVPPSLSFDDPRVARKRVLQVEGHSVGLVPDLVIIGYGFEVAPGVIDREVAADYALADALHSFFGEPVDTVVFGDTHIPMAETHQGVLFVNPGSPTLPRQQRELGTIAILETTSDGREATIVDLTTLRTAGE
jgi:putative phosphoesterase